MARFSEAVARLKDNWLLGFGALLILGLSALMASLVAYVVVMPLAGLLGVWEGERETWVYVSAILWLPPVVGYMVSSRSFRSLSMVPDEEAKDRNASRAA